MRDRQQGWPVICHRVRNFEERQCVCVCRHNGKVSSTSGFRSSAFDQLASGLAVLHGWKHPEKPADSQHELEA